MELAVTASGMVTPVGFNARSSLAALRAGIRNVQEVNLWDGECGEYLAAGKVPLPQWWVGVGKLAELAAPAIRECLQAALPEDPLSIPVLLGVADPERPFRHENLDRDLMPEIVHRLGHELHPASRIFRHDRNSVVHCLEAAREIFTRKRARCCVIAAVDSLLQQELVDDYLEKRRILSPLNSNGFSPGEAASAILVVPAQGAGPDALRIAGCGFGKETGLVESEDPVQGDGLTGAIREAFANARMGIEDVQCRITDLNGEHYKFKEMVLAMHRLERKPKPKLFDLWHPIEFIGDPGAAIGPMVLAIALDAGRRGYAIGPGTLCTFGNDSGERACVVTEYREGGGGR